MTNSESLTTAPANKLFQSYAEASGLYVSNPNETPLKIDRTGEFVITDGIRVALDVQADKELVRTGETIKYTVTIRNDSSVDLYNVEIADVIPPKTTLVAGSFIPALPDDDTLENGVIVGDVLKNSSKLLEFAVTVNDSAIGNVIHTGTVTYAFKDGNGLEYSGTAQSDQAVTTIAAPGMLIEQTADKAVVTKDGEPVVYTITVTNTGDIPIENISVVGHISDGMTYVPNSTLLNSTMPYLDVNPESGVLVGDLAQGAHADVQFTVTVSL